jgi:hypothetical protein
VKAEFSKLLRDHIDELAKWDMAKDSLAPKIDREAPSNAFELVVTLIEMGDEDDQAFLRCFDQAKLNVEDPFHWWQLLHDLIMFQKNGTAGHPRTWTDDEKALLVEQCVSAGLSASPPIREISRICQLLTDRGVRKETKENLKGQITRFDLTNKIQTLIDSAKPG